MVFFVVSYFRDFVIKNLILFRFIRVGSTLIFNISQCISKHLLFL